MQSELKLELIILGDGVSLSLNLHFTSTKQLNPSVFLIEFMRVGLEGWLLFILFVLNNNRNLKLSNRSSKKPVCIKRRNHLWKKREGFLKWYPLKQQIPHKFYFLLEWIFNIILTPLFYCPLQLCTIIFIHIFENRPFGSDASRIPVVIDYNKSPNWYTHLHKINKFLKSFSLSHLIYH